MGKGKNEDTLAMLSHNEARKSKGDLKESAKNFAMHAAGAATGAIAGSAIGKPAGFIGIALLFAGLYWDIAPAVTAGATMALASVTVDEASTSKDRVNLYFDKTADKFNPKKVFGTETPAGQTPAQTPAGTAGLGYLPTNQHSGFSNQGYTKIASLPVATHSPQKLYGLENTHYAPAKPAKSLRYISLPMSVNNEDDDV